jgi:hypothetical protein
MKRSALLLCLVASQFCCAEQADEQRREAEYYVAAYARHYNVPVEFVRAVVEQESGWQRCAVSSKGAAGLMQLMPGTAARLKVRDRCNINQNVSGGPVTGSDLATTAQLLLQQRSVSCKSLKQWAGSLNQ